MWSLIAANRANSGSAAYLRRCRYLTDPHDSDRTANHRTGSRMAQQTFGANDANKVTVSFYSQDGKGCMRYLLSTPNAQPVERCANADSTIAAVRGVEKDSTGNAYTIVAGRSFSSKIVVVSIELDHAENTPAEVSDSGFLAVLPGQRTVISVVPIDEYGNLVGSRYLFR
ncbi:MAG: hypothetical protein ABI947_27780 [Chloroflexota bacterium]